MSPHQRERDVSRCEPRLPLIELNPGYLERLALCLRDCLKIRVAAGEKDDRHIKTVGRVGRIDIRPERLRISVASLLEHEFQLPCTPGNLGIAVSLPIKRN